MLPNNLLFPYECYFRAEAIFQSMKSVYGSHNCYVLKINSRKKSGSDSDITDPWSQHIYPFSDETFVSYTFLPSVPILISEKTSELRLELFW